MLHTSLNGSSRLGAGISGTTRIFAVIGDPVAQVRAPELMNSLFSSVDFNAAMFPVHVASGDLGLTMRALKSWKNLDGILVTIPHKFAACEYADLLSPAAEVAGCANAFRRQADGNWFAENFDGKGFVEGLLSRGFNASRKRVMLVGAGGAGASIAAALARSDIHSLTVTDTDDQRAFALAERINSNGRHVAAVERRPIYDDVDLAINATPVGLSESDPLPFDPKELKPGCLVADVIMKPAETNLLKAASALGLATQAGAAMLDPQIEMYRQFFNVPPISADRSEELLIS